MDQATDQTPPTTPEQLLRFLAGLGIGTSVHEHAPLFTVEESKALRGLLPGGHSKNLFLKDKKDRLWLVVAQEDTSIDLKTLDRRIGSARLSFGRPELLWETLGVRPGSVTPFALINDKARRVQPVLERALLEHEFVNFHPLSNDRTATIRSADLPRFLEATGHVPLVADLA